MKPRTITKTIRRAIKTFPAVVITGPRQSGKITFLKFEFGKTHSYQSLENPEVRLIAKSDPIGFLNKIKMPAISDEGSAYPRITPIY